MVIGAYALSIISLFFSVAMSWVAMASYLKLELLRGQFEELRSQPPIPPSQQEANARALEFDPYAPDALSDDDVEDLLEEINL